MSTRPPARTNWRSPARTAAMTAAARQAVGTQSVRSVELGQGRPQRSRARAAPARSTSTATADSLNRPSFRRNRRQYAHRLQPGCRRMSVDRTVSQWSGTRSPPSSGWQRFCLPPPRLRMISPIRPATGSARRQGRGAIPLNGAMHRCRDQGPGCQTRRHLQVAAGQAVADTTTHLDGGAARLDRLSRSQLQVLRQSRRRDLGRASTARCASW